MANLLENLPKSIFPEFSENKNFNEISEFLNCKIHDLFFYIIKYKDNDHIKELRACSVGLNAHSFLEKRFKLYSKFLKKDFKIVAVLNNV